MKEKLKEEDIKSIEIIFWNNGKVTSSEKTGRSWRCDMKTGEVIPSQFYACYDGGGDGMSLPCKNTEKEFNKLKKQILKDTKLELKEYITKMKLKIKRIEGYKLTPHL